jgi:hypothetical protein
MVCFLAAVEVLDDSASAPDGGVRSENVSKYLASFMPCVLVIFLHLVKLSQVEYEV